MLFGTKNGALSLVFGGQEPQHQCYQDKSFVRFKDVGTLEGMVSQGSKEVYTCPAFFEEETVDISHNEKIAVDCQQADMVEDNSRCTGIPVPTPFHCTYENKQAYWKYSQYWSKIDATSGTYFEIGSKNLDYELPDPSHDAMFLWLAFPSTPKACAGPTGSSSSGTRSEGSTSSSVTSTNSGSVPSSLSNSTSTGSSSSGQGSGEDENPNRPRRNFPADAPDLNLEDRERRNNRARSRQDRSRSAQDLSRSELTPTAGLLCYSFGDIGESLAFRSGVVTEVANASSAPARWNPSRPKTFSGHIGERGLRYCCGQQFWGPPLQNCPLCGQTTCSLCEAWHQDARCI